MKRSSETDIQEGLGPTKSLKSSFEAARNLLGLDCGLIKHKRLGFSVPLAELYDSDQFEKTDEYEKFLDSRGFENPRRTLGNLSNWRFAMLASSMEFRDSYQLHGAYQTLTFKLLYHLRKRCSNRVLEDIGHVREHESD